MPSRKRKGILVYRRPVSPFAAGWPETPQNPGGLATVGLARRALRLRKPDRAATRTPGVRVALTAQPLKLSPTLG